MRQQKNKLPHNRALCQYPDGSLDSRTDTEKWSNYSSGQSAAYLDFHIFVALFCMKIEVYDLWTQARLYLSVHLVTGFYKSFGQLHMISRQPVVSPQRQSTGQKANQVILQDKTTRTGRK